jgi:hypothetical protein
MAYVACTLLLYRNVLGRITSAIVGGGDGYLFVWWVSMDPLCGNGMG